MKAAPSLDDLSLFLAVADAGGLAGAVNATGASAPTLSRRMTQLERDTGKRLFQRGARGYALTADGRALLDTAAPLRGLQATVAGWIAAPARPRVRIAAGIWTARFLAEQIDRVWSPDADWVPEFLASNAVTDIARREADIGIRNRRPDQPWLAGRKTSDIAYAFYASAPAVTGVVLFAGDAPPPSQRWLAAHHGADVVTSATDPRIALRLAQAGLGRVLIPTFAGDGVPGLTRVSDPIPELDHEEWLVSHHEARHDPPVRAALEAIAGVLTGDLRRSRG